MDDDVFRLTALLAGVDPAQAERVLADRWTYARRVVGRDAAGAYVISTAYASDFGCWETAVLDACSPCPVERYGTRAEAEEGHVRWARAAPELKFVHELSSVERDGVKGACVLSPLSPEEQAMLVKA